MSATNSSRLVLGCQFNFSLALVASPIREFTSQGRKYFLSILITISLLSFLLPTSFIPSPSHIIPPQPNSLEANYRESYGLFACNGILFNHESPRRGETFVTRKITRGLSQIDQGLSKYLYLGNLDAIRDWGHAKDYVEIQWGMLQQETPEDFVIATGRQESVRTFIELASKELGWGGIIWEGKGIKEVGRRKDNNQIVIKIDKKYFRPCEVNSLIGDATKAREKLNWQPKTTLEELVSDMIKNDLMLAKKDSLLKNKGYELSFPRD